MRLTLFGFEATVKKAAPLVASSVADNRGGWFPWIREPFTGAWQRNCEWTVDSVLSYHAVWACITLIAQDVGKLRPKLMRQDEDGIWEETTNPAFSPVLAEPNRFQDYIKFKENWMISKLTRGNTYVFLERDNRNVVHAMYVMDPTRVAVLVAPDGSVFYQLGQDNLTGLQEGALTVPASEVIHDRMNCLFHPLVGISPMFACGLAANIGIKIMENGAAFFGNGSNPSGLLVAPTPINQQTADRLKAQWDARYSGPNSGGVAVMGDGLKFEPMRMTSVDAQVVEHLKWTAEAVCSAFHVPPFKIGIGQMPTYQNAEVLNQIYYADCLQAHIESYEVCQDKGLGLTTRKDSGLLGVELDLDGLLRMDSATQAKSLTESIKGGLYTPNEARRKVDKKPLVGGDTVYLQQQQFGIEALHKRDQADPFTKPAKPAAAPAAAAAAPKDFDDSAETRRAIEALIASIDLEATSKGAPEWLE